MQSGSENWNRSVLPLIIPWQWNETLSEESNQTLKLPFSGGHCLQIIRTVLALSLYVIVSLSISLSLCLSDTLCALMSGRVEMLCWFIAWLPKWNLDGMCLSLGHHLERNTCDAQGQLTAPLGMGSSLSHQCILNTHRCVWEIRRYTNVWIDKATQSFTHICLKSDVVAQTVY